MYAGQLSQNVGMGALSQGVGCDVPKREVKALQVMREQGEEIEMLQQAVGRLNERLQSVQTIVPECAGQNDKPVNPCLPPLLDQIKNNTDRLRTARFMVQGILDRLEI